MDVEEKERIKEDWGLGKERKGGNDGFEVWKKRERGRGQHLRQ